MDTAKLGKLQWFFWTLLNNLHAVRRWKGASHPQATPEDVVEHTFVTDTLTNIVVMLERRVGTTDVDFVDLLLLSHTHDNPEGGTGDVNFHVKNDPRISGILKVIEEELFGALLRQHLPEELAQDFERIMSLEKGPSKTSRLFDAIERVGYFVFACFEVAEHRRRSFYKTLHGNYDAVAKYAEEFPNSIGLIWQGMKSLVDELLAKEPAE